MLNIQNKALFNAMPTIISNQSQSNTSTPALKSLDRDTISFKALPDETFLYFLEKTKLGNRRLPSVTDTLAYAVDGKTEVQINALKQHLESGNFDPVYKRVLVNLAKDWGIPIPAHLNQ